MSLNAAPSSERVHIGIFGRRNAGKSSIINALTGQNLALVSDIKGTTTDPVLKAMELLPLGPVVMIDTPGLDDRGPLGSLRVQKAYQILNKTDIAILVVDGLAGMTKEDSHILEQINKKHIPCVVAMNKSDLISAPEARPSLGPDNMQEPAICLSRHSSGMACGSPFPSGLPGIPLGNIISVSTATGENIQELKELIARQAPQEDESHRIVGDLVCPLDFVVLVVPIDKAAPKGRLILPQQQTIRDLLESSCVSIVVRESELAKALPKFGQKPALVITDSQVFAEVSACVPKDIPLTSFSILFARYKGNLEALAKGAKILDILEEGDNILIAEGCTHHRQCEDIGTVKLPLWLKKHTGIKLNYAFTSGTEFPADLSKYRLIIHCGGCTLNEREMKYRIKCAQDQGIPITNYGIAIAHMKGILERSLKIFPNLS